MPGSTLLRGRQVPYKGRLLLLSFALIAGCTSGGGAPSSAPASAEPSSSPSRPVPTVSIAPGETPPAKWQEIICRCYALLHRADAQVAGRAAVDAGTLVLEIIKDAPDWTPGRKLRNAIGRDAFNLFDAGARDEAAMKERLETLNAVDEAFAALTATGVFSCPVS